MFSTRLARQFSAILLFTSFVACKSNSNRFQGVEAKDALSTFQVADGFKIEMIASEPLVSDPVDMEIDEYGRLYVVEMHGYPLDKSGSGRIILLRDENGDGTMDKRVVFKDGLVLPNSIMRWKKGVLVTDAPSLLYLEDSDGDGQADITDTVLTGFALTNPQHNVNSPVYAMDNWIYIAHENSVSTREYKEEFGDEGSGLYFPDAPNDTVLPKNANGRSIRLQPDKKRVEMLASRCQFGHTFDAWGHRFGCNNSNQGFQEVIAERYFSRNPHLLISDATHSMSDHLNAAEVFPTTTNPDRQLLTNVGVMTSACGLTSYLGGMFPEPYQSATFVAEPVSNLVHVDVLKQMGATYTASRLFEQKEFLTSTDSWSRPVNFYVGPDGALYLLDYYRKVIESPEWMSKEAIEAGGLYDGHDKGRIFRITPTHAKAADWTRGVKLGDFSIQELVSTLAHENYWWRINAQRLLVDRADSGSIELLEELTAHSSPYARLHALWTLQGINALKTDFIKKALTDTVAGIRENAIALAELHFTDDVSLVETLLPLQNDPDAKVRMQLLLTLGFVNTPESSAARNKLLFADIGDKWVQIAALSSTGSFSSLINQVISKYRGDVPAYSSLVQRLSAMTASAGKGTEIKKLLRTAVSSSTSAHYSRNSAILQGLAEGLKSRNTTNFLSEQDQQSLLNVFFNHSSAGVRLGALSILNVQPLASQAMKEKSLAQAAVIMNDTATPASRRAEAIDFIALGDPHRYVSNLKKYIDPREEPPVQLASLRTLSKIKGTEVSNYVIRQWNALTPEIRDAAIATFMADSNRIALLIDALEKGTINAGTVSFPTSVQLMQNSNENLRNRARTIFTRNERERVRVNKEYNESLELEGDVAKGREVFMKNCGICHQVRGKMGVAIGPDLGTIQNWIKEDVLANILDPNLSISSGFDLWTVELNNGEQVQGIIASETPVAITLRNFGKLDRTVNRQDIHEIRAASVSAMPPGLEKNISKQQMADLLAFLRKHQDFD